MAGVMNAMTRLQERIKQGPPPGYIPGRGRGATGFMTRGDLGPSAVASLTGEDEPSLEMNDAKYDQFSGYSQSLVRGIKATDADEAAENVYRSVDDHMLNKNKRKMDQMSPDGAAPEAAAPTPKQLIADLKPELASVSQSEWENLPEPTSLRQKKRRKDDAPTSRASDSMVLAAMGTGHDNSISGANPSGFATDVRSTSLSASLKQESDSVSGQTVVDPKGYLTAIESVQTSSVQNTKTMRGLYKALLTQDPHNGDAYIAYSQLESVAGNTKAAKEIIARACDKVPKSEDVWMEAISVFKNTPDVQTIAAKATSCLPKSASLWVARSLLETETAKRAAVLQQGLEEIPKSTRLWTDLVELQEDAETAKVLLRAAVDCVDDVDLWLALAKLEGYGRSKRTLNTAYLKNPTDIRIRIAACQLEEGAGNVQNMEKLAELAVKALYPAHCSRAQWLDEAESCEKTGYVATAKAIVSHSVDLDLVADDVVTREHMYVKTAERFVKQKAYKSARAVYAHGLAQLPALEPLWLEAADLEQQHGTPEEHAAVLQAAVAQCPQSDTLWLMLVKNKWVRGLHEEARAVLANAFASNPDSAVVWAAAAKLEAETGNTDRAAAVLTEARAKTTSGGAYVWMKSAKLQRQLGSRKDERMLLEEATKKYPTDHKLWLMLLHWEEWHALRKEVTSPEDIKKKCARIRKMYIAAVKAASDCVDIWILASHLEEAVCGEPSKARSLLEKARATLPGNAALWQASIRFERRNSQTNVASSMMSKALQECPRSSDLMCLALELEPAGSRKTKAANWLGARGKDGKLCCAVGRMLWAEHDNDRARKYFARAVQFSPDVGDLWAYYYLFEVQHGTAESREQVVEKCKAAAPSHGDLWTKVSKSVANVTMGGCRLTTEQVLKQVSLDLPEYD